jgi:hypothetical protein
MVRIRNMLRTISSWSASTKAQPIQTAFSSTVALETNVEVAVFAIVAMIV